MEDKNIIKKRIDWFCKNKINAFSPTISPAPKSLERNEIESLYEGILWFLNAGVSEIVIQKKYMGSYCDIYLHKNLEQSYLVSRNGFQINHLDKEKWLNALKGLHARFSWENTKIRVIQSELMPWSVLGKGLINNEFSGYYISHQIHCDYLKESDLYEKLNKIKQTPEFLSFTEDSKTLSSKELKEKYPMHVIRQYESVKKFKFLNLENYQNNIQLFKKQLDVFGKDDEMYFKPFNILKEIHSDGSETFINDNLSFKQVNDDDFLHYKFENQEDFEQKFPEIQLWVNQVNQSNEEGVMIKPRTAFLSGMPPAFKVRNNDYLTLVYGIDFQDRLQENIAKRNIKSKLKCSINDWAINQKMIKMPYNQIDEENYYFKNLVLDRILGEEIEKQLDSRL
ncbi:hypothetical protein [Capnocytophaga stomatis]|uniref:Polynucleotide kinase-phosphatase ligase domain-containing protein n=1 Tax=Capnocytophaga stomatis TaxID=1848904 RepID=A0A250FU50_9FLAO|nr:hypothetical protein [Capnocytophaga stomatis]ATA88594.1 hypothetical protein CGC58_01885 [Capnocytophaga stomatis]GIJ93318.1 hypothetical protein CAPN002_05360 [Capnocytophaga stomatis]GIJ96449.1 hypothetical protein CAPN001_10180 [Capnocytophaga stomatis]